MLRLNISYSVYNKIGFIMPTSITIGLVENFLEKTNSVYLKLCSTSVVLYCVNAFDENYCYVL